MFKLRVQEGTTASALATSHPHSVTESFLHVGDVVVRRQDTAHTRVQVTEPLVGDVRLAQVFDSRHLLTVSFGEECALQPESSPISQPRKLRLELQRTESAFTGR